MPRVLAMLVALGLLAAACGGDDDPVLDSSVTVPSTTADPIPSVPEATIAGPDQPVYPLTGALQTDAESADRPALVIKIDNDNNTRSRPQAGLNQADLLYEIAVEGGVTRFAAVYHSTLPEAVGPIRSARSSDLDIVPNLNQPLFAWWGNNTGVGSEVRRAVDNDAFVRVDQYTAAATDFYYRESGRRQPHNGFVDPHDLVGLAEDDQDPPGPLFEYRNPDEEPSSAAREIPGIAWVGDNRESSYVWNEAEEVWVRYQDGTLHVDTDDVPVTTENVVLLEINYGRSNADPASPQALTTGSSGDAWVLSQGRITKGTWVRPFGQSPWILTDAFEDPIQLVPGRTHVLFARSDEGVELTDDDVAELVG